MKQHRTLLITCIIAILIGAGVGVLLAKHTHKTTQTAQTKALVSTITSISGDSKKLCSAYANSCFTYPASWKQSKILHGGNFYGESSSGGIELNPPSGTIVSFAKVSAATNTVCKPGCVCTIHVSKLKNMGNGLYVLAASFESANASAGSDRYSPFVAIVSGTLLRTAGIAANTVEAGKVVTVSSFNPGFSIAGGGQVELLASPGNAYGPVASANWLASSEAQTIVTAVSSITPSS